MPVDEKQNLTPLLGEVHGGGAAKPVSATLTRLPPVRGSAHSPLPHRASGRHGTWTPARAWIDGGAKATRADELVLLTRNTAPMSVDELDLLLERLPRHHLFADIPAALRGWLLPIDWDRERLWALDLPRLRLELEALRWHFDLPWWRHDGVWFQVTPREFLADPTGHPEHADRVANADLCYPLHIIRRRGRWLILDGIHRLARAEMLGLNDIIVSPLEPEDLAKIARTP